MLHLARLIDRRSGAGKGMGVHVIVLLSGLALCVGMLLLAWR